jgi:tRNA threonylcarbamoyladenosine biosynthesis protein TsaB
MAERIIALDATTEACSVALASAGRVVRRWEYLPGGHSARILEMVEEVFAEAGESRSAVDAIAFCRGPGSFTGVRIAAGVAQGLALALDRPLLPVSTLATLAMGALRRDGAGRVIAALDARMGEVYVGAFRSEAALPVALDVERVAAPESVTVPEAGAEWVGVGTGFGAYPQLLEGVCRLRDGERLPDAQDILPLARDMLARGGAVGPEAALPVYLRDRVTG